MFVWLGLIDSIAEELTVKLRDSKRSSGMRLSNGSLSQDNRLSSPPSQSVHLEDGPVLRPPPTNDEPSTDQVGE